MQQLHYKIITNAEEARKIWEIFSPHQVIDDEWEFRDNWRNPYDFPFHFIVGYDGEKPVGLLALQRNTLLGLSPKLLNMDVPFLEFFGGVDTDDNKVFLLPGYESYVEGFLDQIKEPAVLNSLSGEYKFEKYQTEFYLDRFIVDLEGISDFDSYIELHFSGKTRRNLKKEIRRNKLEGYSLEIRKGEEADLELMFTLSQERFGERSSFHRDDRKKIFHNLYNSVPNDLFVIVLNNAPKAVVFAILNNKTYTGVNAGYDYSIPNLGKVIFTETVKRAVSLGYTLYDVGQGTSNWKDRLHLTKVPQYKLTLNYEPGSA